MDIEVVVVSEVIKVGSIIPEQYTLKMLWDDIKDMMATIRRESENYVDAARDYGFRSPVEQFPISLDKEIEFEWFDLAKVNEIIVPDLNEAVITSEFESSSVIVEDSFKER
ncbi:hypothetical protein WN943_003575 [Citrus x changshan-huyou]